MPKPKILVIPGSLRTKSFNKMLASYASEVIDAVGGEASVVDLRDYPMPIFDEDFEAAQGAPDTAKSLKELCTRHTGLLFCCPEYNSSITAALKNTIDWLSRESAGGSALAAFQGKIVGLMAASPGQLGGLRGLVTVRSILGNIGAIVLPDQFALSNAQNAFGEDGKLKDPKAQAGVTKVVKSLVATSEKFTQ